MDFSQKAALEKYLDGKISKEVYQTSKTESGIIIKQASAELSTLDVLDESVTDYAQHHKPFYSADELTRDMVKTLIKKIKVYSGDRIEIVWIFEDCYYELLQMLDMTA